VIGTIDCYKSHLLWLFPSFFKGLTFYIPKSSDDRIYAFHLPKTIEKQLESKKVQSNLTSFFSFDKN